MGRAGEPSFRRLAAAYVIGGNPPSAIGYGFASIQRQAIGEYELTLDKTTLAQDYLTFANVCRVGSGRTVVDQGAGTLTVFTLDSAGAPTDAAEFSIFIENKTGGPLPVIP